MSPAVDKIEQTNTQTQTERNLTDEQFRDKMQECIDTARHDFALRLTTNHFSTRAKIGQVLAMRIGAIAEDGDIVALGNGDTPQQCRVAWYADGIEYYAVCVAIMSARLELVGEVA
jgi:SOS-response transcriptional repressor LexA